MLDRDPAAGIDGKALAAAAERPTSTLQMGTFACDVTPPTGHPLCGGWVKAVVGVDDPELAKGVVLRDGGGTYVLCAIDWCELRNDAYDLMRAKIAEAAGTSPSRVAVQCVHQHNAPLTDLDAEELVKGGKAGRLVAGFRSAPAADASALQDLVHRLGRLAEEIPEVGELDLNPVLAGPDGCVAVDARVRLRKRPNERTLKSW